MVLNQNEACKLPSIGLQGRAFFNAAKNQKVNKVKMESESKRARNIKIDSKHLNSFKEKDK